MSKGVLIFSKREDSAARQACQTLRNHLNQSGMEVEDVSGSEDRISESRLRRYAAAVVFGGDGTFLTLVQRMERKDVIPLMGVNLGTLGFITEFGKDDFQDAVKKALSGELAEVRRPLLEVELWRKGHCVEKGMVFNDVVVNKDTRTSLCVMDVSVDGQMLNRVRADGYIVATAIGSTGYALSAGGPLVHPDVPAVVLVPICPHSLSSRPIVIPNGQPVHVRVHRFGGNAYLVCDGQINIEMHEGDELKIHRQSDAFLRMFRAPKQAWTDALKAKLHLG